MHSTWPSFPSLSSGRGWLRSRANGSSFRLSPPHWRWRCGPVSRKTLPPAALCAHFASRDILSRSFAPISLLVDSVFFCEDRGSLWLSAVGLLGVALIFAFGRRIAGRWRGVAFVALALIGVLPAAWEFFRPRAASNFASVWLCCRGWLGILGDDNWVCTGGNEHSAARCVTYSAFRFYGIRNTEYEGHSMESSGFRRGEWMWVIVAATCIVTLASLPYVIVALTTPPDLRFAGTLINPFDGNSYFAKMQIGAQGGWLFHLPYTSQDHPGALLFSFHILLGHIAAWTRLPIPLVYHLARIIAGFGL